MMKKRYILIGLLTTLLACSEEVVVAPYTYPQVFTGETSRAWVLRSIQVVRAGKSTISLPPDFFLDNEGETCVSDDIYTFYFNSERSYTVTEGRSKCNPEDPDLVLESNWSFVNSTATLTIEMPPLASQPLPFIIYEADDTKLVLDIYLDEQNKNNYRFNFKRADSD